MNQNLLRKICITIISSFFYFWTYGQNYTGFFNFQYEESSGKLLLNIEKLKEPFLLVNSFGTGIGSNDLGMDRGKLMDERVVHFEKQGDRILLVQPNLDFRANTSNKLEKASVEEAFAFSVLYGAKIEKVINNTYVIDFTPFLVDDQNGIVTTLKESKQGAYKLEKSRSALFLENTHAFPDNCEFESILTFTGEATGQYIRSVTPSPEAVSVRQHISLIRLPDDKYKPRVFHPESGYFSMSYFDYATPIHSPIEKRFITRHRLEKKNPNAAISDPIKPIIYYIDAGCPEPIKSALIEGGKWWAQAFEAAGFSNAFDVRELPSGAHPLNVRYNMIQWVHRSTRGWSYGSSISDPRTGEILKGHVSLGSLRVRQDFMLAQGMIPAYKDGDNNHDIMTQMALDRLKQLSAHEIGHTIGLAHNFAASMNNRASVMDYPHPLVTLTNDGKLDFSKAYDDKIGIWDKRAIMYGYSQFSDANAEDQGLKNMIIENINQGLYYLTDEDGRGVHSASSITHLWDNGQDAIEEMKRINTLRSHCIGQFGLDNVPSGTPLSELEKVFVPLYLMYRYQAEAVGKLIGGYDYSYGVKGFPRANPITMVDAKTQQEARRLLLSMFSVEKLGIPLRISELLLPPAQAYPRTRESFNTQAGPTFDVNATYETAIGHILDLLINNTRFTRLQNQHLLDEHIREMLIYFVSHRNDEIARLAEIHQILRIKSLMQSESISHSIKSVLASHLKEYLMNKKGDKKVTDIKILQHNDYLRGIITSELEDYQITKLPNTPNIPPGQPIGSCSFD